MSMFEKPFVDLRDGKKQCMAFSGYRIENRRIPDKTTGGTKVVEALVLLVRTLNGTPVRKEFSVMAQNLKLTLEPYIKSGQINTRTFCIQRHGIEHAATYEVEVK